MAAFGSALVASLSLGGCGEEEKPQEVVRDEAPPPPPPPPPPSVADLAAQLNIDPRIRMADDELPGGADNDAVRAKMTAVLTFFDAMVRGDDQRLAPMLSSADREVLDDLVRAGLFAPAAQRVTQAVVGCGQFQFEMNLVDAVFALVQSGSDFEAQLWTYTIDDQGNATFDAVPTPPHILTKLTGTKATPRIRQWAAVLNELVEESRKPDEEVDFGHVNYGFDSEGGTTADSVPDDGGGAPSSPSTPSRGREGPGRRAPGAPVAPPRAPGLR